MRSSAEDRSTIIAAGTGSLVDSFAEDVARGLSASPKHIPCIYFYDYPGSLIFEEICQLPEYYLTDAEAEILKNSSEEIISYVPQDSLLVELGSGSCMKTRYIIEELLNQYDKVVYSPIDISRRMLKESAMSLLEKYDDLEVISVAAEYGEGLRRLNLYNGQPKFILWLGSSLGNFEMTEAVAFLKSILSSLSSEDFFLIGFDLEKDKSILERAYNDSGGVTARFNLNLLARINRELEGEFDPDLFAHRAIYNDHRRRIEMYLVSTCEQQIYIGALGESYRFSKGERIHTENSHKFSKQSIATLAREAGMRIVRQWLDERGYFCLTLFQADPK